MNRLKPLKCSKVKMFVTRLVWSLAAALRLSGVTGLGGVTRSNPERPSSRGFFFSSTNHFPRWCRVIQEVGSKGRPMQKLAFHRWPVMPSSHKNRLNLSMCVSVALYVCVEGEGRVDWCPATHPPVTQRQKPWPSLWWDRHKHQRSVCMF